MHSGKLKAFNSLTSGIRNSKLSARRKRQSRERSDHCMDAMRYLVMSGLSVMQRQAKEPEHKYVYTFPGQGEQRWMQ